MRKLLYESVQRNYIQMEKRGEKTETQPDEEEKLI